MSEMPDPTDLIENLQHSLNDGLCISSHELDNGYKMFYDEPFVGGRRFIFAKIVNNQVQAMSIFGLEDDLDGITCWNVGYAVLKSYQRQGLASEAFNHGVMKLKEELKREGINKFVLEAVVDINNTPSVKLTEKLFKTQGQDMKENFTGAPALHFNKIITIP